MMVDTVDLYTMKKKHIYLWVKRVKSGLILRGNNWVCGRVTTIKLSLWSLPSFYSVC